jgi:hypothetical protein
MVYPRDEVVEPWVTWEEAGLKRQYDSMVAGEWQPTPRQFYTANSSVPRDVYLKVGLFDPEFLRAEDVEIAYRFMDVGVRFLFLPHAIVLHRPHRRFGAWQRMARQYGHYDVAIARKQVRPEIFELMGYELLYRRPALIRRLGHLLVGRDRTLAFACGAASLVGAVAARLHLSRPARAAYSIIFNLNYLQAAAEAFGAPKRSFLSRIEAVAAPVDFRELMASPAAR